MIQITARPPWERIQRKDEGRDSSRYGGATRACGRSGALECRRDAQRAAAAEADQICKAGRYERSPERVNTRAGHYERKLETKAGAVVLKMPKLRSLPLETAIIERYRRREASVEEALVEMYLAGVSVRRVEDITKRCGAPG